MNNVRRPKGDRQRPRLASRIPGATVPQEALSIQHRDHVYRIALARPECGNLITMEMIAALADALQRLPADAKLIVIAGQGADFCKGRDYQSAPESAREGRPPSARQILDSMTTPVLTAYRSLREAPVPTLAVVQGAAYGFGCALACACDIVLAAEGSRFRFPEMNRGLPPTLAMHAVMDRVSARALSYLVYSAAEIDARAALTLGLASVVVPDAELGGTAETLVRGITKHPSDAIKAVKTFLQRAPSMEPGARAEFAATLFATVLSSR